MSGRTRALAVVVIGAALSVPVAAYACTPDEYLTPEERASGLYDTGPSEWGGDADGASHTAPAPAEPTVAPAPPSATTGPAPGDATGAQPQPGVAPTAPAGSPAPAAPKETLRAKDAEPRAKQRERPAQRGTPAPRQAPAAAIVAPSAAAAPVAPAAAVAANPGRTTIAATEREAPKRRPARSPRPAPVRTTVAPVSERVTGRPAAPVRVAAAESTESSRLLIGVAAAFGVLLVMGCALVVLRRRRGPADTAASLAVAGPSPRTSGAADAMVEAELQEIIAEERARRLATGDRSPPARSVP